MGLRESNKFISQEVVSNKVVVNHGRSIEDLISNLRLCFRLVK